MVKWKQIFLCFQKKSGKEVSVCAESNPALFKEERHIWKREIKRTIKSSIAPFFP